jgi:hypothetical protein
MRSRTIMPLPPRWSLALVLWACGDAAQELARPHPGGEGARQSHERQVGRGRDYDPRRPFECGEIDAFDLEAIESGGALERGCSTEAPGTWVAVADRLRRESDCRDDCAIVDPEAHCAFSECANAYFEAGARSTCDDLSPFLEVRLGGASCNLANYYRPNLNLFQ